MRDGKSKVEHDVGPKRPTVGNPGTLGRGPGWVRAPPGALPPPPPQLASATVTTPPWDRASILGRKSQIRPTDVCSAKGRLVR